MSHARHRLAGVALVCGALVQVGCAPTTVAPGAAPPVDTRLEVVDPLLDERIEYLAARSTSFRRAWQGIRESGVPVTVGTATQLWDDLPSSFRKNPESWAGVTVARSASSDAPPRRAYVAIQRAMVEEMAKGAVVNAQGYLLGEIDRLLIHEIYGHLAPMFAVDGPHRECSDEVRPGQARPCVEVREEHVADELAAYQPLGVAGR